MAHATPNRSTPTRFWIGLALGLALVLLGAFAMVRLTQQRLKPRRTVPLPSEAYVWQRLWTDEVRQSVAASAPWLTAYHSLAAEMRLDSETGELKVAQVLPHWDTLAALKRPAGAVIRIFPSLAKTGWDAGTIVKLGQLVEAILQESSKAGVPLREIQLDYDCPASKLADYTRLLKALKARLKSAPLIQITALPSWLKHADFPALAAESPGYVMQVHSLHLPTSGSQLVTLVDSKEAQGAVEAAVKIGVPFRIALPTYSCVAEFDDKGKVREVYAEDFPKGLNLQDGRHLALDADAYQMEALVTAWRRDASPLIQAVIWYRLPVAGDRLNWPAGTLEKLCREQPLSRGWHAEMRLSTAGYQDIILRQTGDAPDDLPREIELRWSGGATPVAADGLRGYDNYVAGDGWTKLRLMQPFSRLRVPPGGSLVAGWLRLDPASAPVRVELQ